MSRCIAGSHGRTYRCAGHSLAHGAATRYHMRRQDSSIPAELWELGRRRHLAFSIINKAHPHWARDRLSTRILLLTVLLFRVLSKHQLQQQTASLLPAWLPIQNRCLWAALTREPPARDFSSSTKPASLSLCTKKNLLKYIQIQGQYRHLPRSTFT